MDLKTEKLLHEIKNIISVENVIKRKEINKELKKLEDNTFKRLHKIIDDFLNERLNKGNK